jgi:ribonuclease HII
MSTTVIIGIDEVGRGPVFGPLCVAGVVNYAGWQHPEVTDSKRVGSEAKRQRLAEAIRENLPCYHTFVHAKAINRMGITAALHQAVQETIENLLTWVTRHIRDPEIHIKMDGNDFPNVTCGRYALECIIKGDLKVFEIGAASLVAKVARDTWVHELVANDPAYWGPYDLDSNKGYGTPNHTTALLELGPTAQHRTLGTGSLMQHALEKAQAPTRHKSPCHRSRRRKKKIS